MIVLLIFSYRIGVVEENNTSTLNDNPLSCKIVKIYFYQKLLVISDKTWNLVDINKHELYSTISYKSYTFKKIAFISTETLNGMRVGIPPTGMSEKTDWEPKLRYKSSELSFYRFYDKYLVIRNIKL